MKTEKEPKMCKESRIIFCFVCEIVLYLIALNEYVDVHDGSSQRDHDNDNSITTTVIILQKQNALKEMPSK